MPAFLRSPAEILFGAGQRHALGRVVATQGRRAVVFADPYLVGSPQWPPLLERLEQSGVAVRVCSDVVPELPVESLDRALSEARAASADVVVAVGGGSCIDLAKVTAALLTHGGRAADLYGEFAVPGPTLPVVAVPTTAGTGSEVTPVAVLTDSRLASKVGISSPHLIPRVALCDPELTLSCPPALTASAGADALTHAVEALTATRRDPVPGLSLDRVFVGSSALTDQLATQAVRHVVSGLPRAVADGDDLDARADVMYGALLAGLAFGTAGTSAAHALQYPIGALTHSSHGTGVGLLLPYLMTLNLPARPEEMAAVAGAFTGEPLGDAASAPTLVRDLLTGIGIPTRLDQIGFPEDRIPWAAERAVEARRLSENNPVPFTRDVAERVLRAAWSGELSSVDEVAPVGGRR